MKTVTLQFAHDHPAFAGHFPGLPIVPGVLLLDEALHAITTEIGHVGGWQLAAVKFLSPLGPDVAAELSYAVQSSGAYKFDIRAGERLIASGSATPQPA